MSLRHGERITADLSVDSVERTPDGRYKGTPRIRANVWTDPKLGVRICVFAYFDDSDKEVLTILDQLRRGARITVEGAVIRSEIDQFDKSITLTIDLFGCTFPKI
jgi:hypothetical protein